MYLRLLRTNRDFRLLYFGTLISLGGDWFLTVALLDLVLQLTGSATLASVMMLCQTLPIFLFTPHAGHIIDRVDRQKLMIAVDLARAVACLLPLFARTPALLPFAYAGVIVISIGSAYFEPASHAALPNLVARDDLGPANVLMGSTWGTMLAVGAALGGAVTVQFGRNTAFLVDSASFILSAVLLKMISRPFSENVEQTLLSANPVEQTLLSAEPVEQTLLSAEPAEQTLLSAEREQTRVSVLQSIRETVRFARSHPRVLALLTVKGGYGLSAGVIAMLSVFGREVFRAGAWGIGLLFAARGLGALVGPFIVRFLVRRDESQYRSIAVCVLVFGVGYSSLALSKSLAFGLLAIFLAHLGGGAAWQISSYGLQRETPDFIRGRVFAADYGFVTLSMAVSSLGAGIASDRFGPFAATYGTATLSLLFGVAWAAWTWRLWRSPR